MLPFTVLVFSILLAVTAYSFFGGPRIRRNGKRLRYGIIFGFSVSLNELLLPRKNFYLLFVVN
jgi:hypothetical protein